MLIDCIIDRLAPAVGAKRAQRHAQDLARTIALLTSEHEQLGSSWDALHPALVGQLRVRAPRLEEHERQVLACWILVDYVDTVHPGLAFDHIQLGAVLAQLGVPSDIALTIAGEESRAA